MLKWLANIGIYILIFVVVLLGLPKLLVWALDTNYPMAAITSGSMWPALKEGDLVFIQGIKKEALQIGDIIVFRNQENGTLTIHRIVRLDDDALVTKGDANFTEDEPTKYEDVVGRMLRLAGRDVRIPYLGSITMYANNPKQQDAPAN